MVKQILNKKETELEPLSGDHGGPCAWDSLFQDWNSHIPGDPSVLSKPWESRSPGRLSMTLRPKSKCWLSWNSARSERAHHKHTIHPTPTPLWVSFSTPCLFPLLPFKCVILFPVCSFAILFSLLSVSSTWPRSHCSPRTFPGKQGAVQETCLRCRTLPNGRVWQDWCGLLILRYTVLQNVASL